MGSSSALGVVLVNSSRMVTLRMVSGGLVIPGYKDMPGVKAGQAANN
jgi:hypothetical protein